MTGTYSSSTGAHVRVPPTVEERYCQPSLLGASQPDHEWPLYGSNCQPRAKWNFAIVLPRTRKWNFACLLPCIPASSVGTDSGTLSRTSGTLWVASPPPRSNVGHLREWRPRPHRQHCSGGRGCVCEVPFRTGGCIIPAVSQGHALCGSLADADARPCFLARAAQVTGACFVRLSARHGRQVMCAGACSAGTLTACSALRGGRLRRSGGVLAGTEAPGAWACGREARECVFWPVLRRSGGVLAATEAPGAWACGREARECVFFWPARRTGT